MPQLKDGSNVDDVRLDRLQNFDDRSRNYGVAQLVGYTSSLKTKTWALPRTQFVDQKNEGACVSAGFGHDTAAMPLATSQLKMPWLREKVYHQAQREDPWEGGAYPGASPQYEGTSVLAGAKVMQRFGFFDSYHWCFTIDEVISAVVNLGSIVVGWNWTEGQMHPQPNGLMKYEGNVLGGHCVSPRGIWCPDSSGVISRIPGKPKVGEPVLVIPQSWGLGYGNKGEVYMPLSEAEKAMNNGGEQLVPTERKRVDIKRISHA